MVECRLLVLAGALFTTVLLAFRSAIFRYLQTGNVAVSTTISNYTIVKTYLIIAYFVYDWHKRDELAKMKSNDRGADFQKIQDNLFRYILFYVAKNIPTFNVSANCVHML